MAFFQNSVLNKHLKGQDAETIKIAYQKFTAYFHNPVIQQNIRDAKEEQFQEGFLRELFVNILGYTLNPHAEYNLTTELKNEKGAKKADGAILQEGKALGVIELKGTDTKDLDKINVQAFNYKNNQRGCIYVITSNFEKLRFFIHHSVEHLEFNLFTLTESEFQLLWLCLRADNLLSGVPLKIKEESLLVEEKITKQLYKDYAAFRNDLWQNMVKNSHAKDKLLLFKKTQKLLDRYLFIFFAEDSGLLPPNSISRIVKRWEVLKQEDAYKPLYDIFKQYFGYIDTGRKGQKEVDDIFAYNGGLFQPDEVLDNIVLDDEMLHPNVMKLTNYDFQSEVDVNILGHIFENSLNEIENITAELEGQEVDKTKSKRKKDGVFYTPKYITKYIVDNTVGKLCEEKKTELGIIDEEYAKGRRNRKKDIIKKLDENLQAYRNWLLNITICDPACGSGAFLNQALEFLMEEHAYVDELQAQLFGASIVFQDVSNHILEKNIFGVDINEESVDIAKLSLWLRTAQRGRKLTTLNNNIKCGNSLIDDPELAGEKAFNWQEEFPTVFEKGGFDVVIGNPPYVRQELVKQYSEALKSYSVFSGKGDLYTYFYEKGYEILKKNGYLSFISSGKFFEASYGKPLVDFLVKNFTIDEVINFDDLEVFEGISAYPLIFTGIKKKNENYLFKYCFVPEHNFSSISQIITNLPFNKVHITDFIEFDYNFYNKEIAHLFQKINTNSIYLKDIGCLPLVGVKTGYNEGFTSKQKYNKTKPYIFGKNLKKYLTPTSDTEIVFPYQRNNNEYQLVEESELEGVVNLLGKSRTKLEQRAIICDGIKNGTKKWYEYQQINKKIDFDSEYIVYPNVSLGSNFTLSKGNVIDMTGFIIPSNDKFLLGILNSKVCEFVMRKLAITRRGGYQEYKVQYLGKVPIKQVNADRDNIKIIEKVDTIIERTSSFQNLQNQFIQLLQSKFTIEKLTKKLENWYELEFGDFLKELKKAKVQLSLSEESEWMQYFNEQKQKAQALKTEINRVDAEIDKMVYELYGLTEEEIKIVEES